MKICRIIFRLILAALKYDPVFELTSTFKYVYGGRLRIYKEMRSYLTKM